MNFRSFDKTAILPGITGMFYEIGDPPHSCVVVHPVLIVRVPPLKQSRKIFPTLLDLKR